MRCEHCGGELVEVDNPMCREVRHRRGVVCPGGRSEDAPTPTDHSAETPMTDEQLEAIRERHQLEWIERPDRVIGERDDPWCGECGEQHPCEPARLLDEVDRLRAELAGYKRGNDELSRRITPVDNALFDAGVETIPLEAGIKDLADTRDALAAKLDRANEVARGWEATAAQHYLRLVEYRDERDVLAARLDAVTAQLTEVWELLDGGVRHDCLSPNHNDPCHRRATSVLLEAVRRVLTSAPESPRPPAEAAPTEYMVVVPSMVGNLESWTTTYHTDGVRKPTRDEAIAHGLEAEGHDDWLIGIVSGDKLTRLAYMQEDRDDAEEIAEAAESLGLGVPEMPDAPAEAHGDGLAADSGSTGVPGPEDSAQESDWPDVDGWTIAPHPDGVAAYDTTDRPALSGLTIPLGAVLAFIADLPPVPSEEDTDV